jgi:hypothetical protein
MNESQFLEEIPSHKYCRDEELMNIKIAVFPESPEKNAILPFLLLDGDVTTEQGFFFFLLKMYCATRSQGLGESKNQPETDINHYLTQ